MGRKYGGEKHGNENNPKDRKSRGQEWQDRVFSTILIFKFFLVKLIERELVPQSNEQKLRGKDDSAGKRCFCFGDFT